MANSFELRDNARQQHLKERPEPPVSEIGGRSQATPEVPKLESRKRRKQTYTVYLDRDLMDRVQRLARKKDVAASAVIEACVKMSLEKLEG